jgi:predicted alpha/beta hydrolase family esterase
MPRRVFIIHGWEGNPDIGWIKWLERELQRRGFDAHAPWLPDPNRPQFEKWMSAMERMIGTPDEDTFLVGHSLGCMAVIRYLERLPAGIRVRGAMIVGGRAQPPRNVQIDDPDDRSVLMPWIGHPVDWDKVLSHTDNFTGIFSDNDPRTPLGEAKKLKRITGGNVIIKHAMAHFEEETTETLPDALEVVLAAFAN